jgi:phosphatidyl-myo-inositol dimannoside synthase
MKRIIYGSPGLFDMGGIARYGRAQVLALRSLQGADVQVISMLGPNSAGFDEAIDVDVIAGGNGPRNKIRFAQAFLGRLRPRQIYWAGHLNYTPLVVPLAAISSGAAVVNIYGLEVWSNRSRLKEGCLKRCWVIADCHATLETATAMGIVDPQRSAVIHDPVDVSFFRPGAVDSALAAKYSLVPDGRFRLMFLGRLDEGSRHKGPDRLIRAFASAKLSLNAELIIAGSGTQKRVLERLAAECGVGDAVKFIGRVPDKELPGLFRLATAFALVSQKYEGGGEGIPLTPLEAGACGIPVIVGNEDGSVEACVDGQSGFIVASRDSGALCNAIEKLDKDRQLARRMGDAMCARVRQMFSLERFVKQHAEFAARIDV